MIRTTHILAWIGIVLLWVGLAYRVGGWRNWWTRLRQPVSARTVLDPRYEWWATPLAALGFGLMLLSEWRSWRGL